jgi:hypothetical protein
MSKGSISKKEIPTPEKAKGKKRNKKQQTEKKVALKVSFLGFLILSY